jgi:hypothetical protein
MPGDRTTSEDGRQVEFRHTREERAVRVVPTRTVILGMVAALAAGGVSVGGVTMWAAKAFIAEQIHIHDRDPEAHAAYVRTAERLKQDSEVNDAEKARLQAQLDALSRDVRETREAVIRLEAQLRKGGR